jgi:hypothetical protein
MGANSGVVLIRVVIGFVFVLREWEIAGLEKFAVDAFEFGPELALVEKFLDASAALLGE